MIRAALGLDISGFRRGLDGARSAVGSFASSTAALGVASAGAAVAAYKLNQAFAQGEELSNLSEQTGVAVGRLLMLQNAMLEVGLKSEEAGPLLNKMQKKIGEAALQGGDAAKAFSRLGLSASQLSTLTGDQQLLAIGKALSAIENPTLKATLAMQVFEESGGKMLRLFNASGMSAIGGQLTNQARILQESAESMAAASNKLEAIGRKAKNGFGFFTGMAAEMSPIVANLEPRIDLSGIGQSLGMMLSAKSGAEAFSKLFSGDYGKGSQSSNSALPFSLGFDPITPALKQETISSSLQRIGGGGGYAASGGVMDQARRIAIAVERIVQNTAVLGQLTDNRKFANAGTGGLT